MPNAKHWITCANWNPSETPLETCATASLLLLSFYSATNILICILPWSSLTLQWDPRFDSSLEAKYICMSRNALFLRPVEQRLGIDWLQLTSKDRNSNGIIGITDLDFRQKKIPIHCPRWNLKQIKSILFLVYISHVKQEPSEPIIWFRAGAVNPFNKAHNNGTRISTLEAVPDVAVCSGWAAVVELVPLISAAVRIIHRELIAGQIKDRYCRINTWCSYTLWLNRRGWTSAACFCRFEKHRKIQAN